MVLVPAVEADLLAEQAMLMPMRTRAPAGLSVDGSDKVGPPPSNSGGYSVQKSRRSDATA